MRAVNRASSLACGPRGNLTRRLPVAPKEEVMLMKHAQTPVTNEEATS